jgi:hypothetical protein
MRARKSQGAIKIRTSAARRGKRSRTMPPFAKLIAAEDVADFMQSSRIGAGRPDRANPNLTDPAVCLSFALCTQGRQRPFEPRAGERG